MENGPFTDGLPIKHGDFPMAMLNNQRVLFSHQFFVCLPGRVSDVHPSQLDQLHPENMDMISVTICKLYGEKYMGKISNQCKSIWGKTV
jgi:hypothetical protein